MQRRSGLSKIEVGKSYVKMRGKQLHRFVPTDLHKVDCTDRAEGTLNAGVIEEV
jgi:hypothetical protein